MKKLFGILMLLTLLLPSGLFSKGSYIELVAGRLNIRGKNIGIVQLTPLSYIYKWGSVAMKPVDNILTTGLKHEMINKGAKIMILDPPGMEQILSQFIDIRAGKFSTKEVITASADKALLEGMKNTKADLTAGISLIEKLLSVNELSGENTRLENYSSFYKNVINLWGISSLITVQQIGVFGAQVRGYQIDGASAALVFQYNVMGNKDNWQGSFPVKYKDDEWKRDGYTIIDDSSIKYESSLKRQIEVVKRVSQFLD